MSLLDDKKNVFTSIGSFTSLSQQDELPNPTNTYSSVNNSKDGTSFIIEVLKITVGTLALKQLTGDLLTTFLDSTEPKLKNSLKKQLTQVNSDTSLPSTFNNGIQIPAKDIDIFNKLKTDPNSNVHDLLFDNSKPTFDNKAYEAIVNNGTTVPYNNLLINFDENTENFTLKPSNTNVTINDWFNDYIDNTEIINRKEFTAKVMDGLYGSISSNENKSLDQLKNELEIKEVLNKLINENDNLDINEDNLNKIFEDAENLKNGYVPYDMGCGIFKMSLSISGMTDLLNNVLNTEDSYEVSNIIENNIYDNALGNNDILENNKDAVKDSFFSRLINEIKYMLVNSLVLNPQARMLQGLNTAFTNNGVPDIGNPKDDIKKQKTFIGCISNETKSILNEFIFNMAKTALIALLTPIIRKVLREKINQFIRLIKSLIN